MNNTTITLNTTSYQVTSVPMDYTAVVSADLNLDTRNEQGEFLV
jgi:hypothetical protein